MKVYHRVSRETAAIRRGSAETVAVCRVNWFRCYHTQCDNRHRILSRWFQLDY